MKWAYPWEHDHHWQALFMKHPVSGDAFAEVHTFANANLPATATEYGNAWEISSRSRLACRALPRTRCNFCGEMAGAGL
jgi:hypothetical protein